LRRAIIARPTDSKLKNIVAEVNARERAASTEAAEPELISRDYDAPQ
jgi:hypothetical protein